MSRNELKSVLSSGFAALGFSSFNLGCHKANKYELALDPTVVTWPSDFVREYERRNWGDNDPNLALAATTDRPFRWSIRDRYPDSMKQSYIDYLVSTPLTGGIAVPLPRRPGTLSSVSVESHGSLEFCDATVHAVTLIAHTALAKAETLGLCDNISADEASAQLALTDKQIEILKWAAAGKSNLDIATIMNLSRRTIEYHMAEIFKKLGVATRSQAVAILAARK